MEREQKEVIPTQVNTGETKTNCFFWLSPNDFETTQKIPAVGKPFSVKRT